MYYKYKYNRKNKSEIKKNEDYKKDGSNERERKSWCYAFTQSNNSSYDSLVWVRLELIQNSSESLNTKSRYVYVMLFFNGSMSTSQKKYKNIN